MPTVSSISFNVKFDLTGAPTLVLTDTTTFPSGALGIFTITLPDGYIRTGSFTSPDITSSGGTFSMALRLDSLGKVQCGTYDIKYEIKTTDTVISTFTRNFVQTYKEPTLSLKADMDVFAPDLLYTDITSYQVNNYAAGSVTRAWSVVSTPTGTLTGSGVTMDFAYTAHYYDALYTITLASSLLYQHSTYAWLSVQETVSKTVTDHAYTPLTIEELIVLMETLRENATNCAGDIPQFEKASALFSHLINLIKLDGSGLIPQTGIYDTYNDLMEVLHNNQSLTFTHTNLALSPYSVAGTTIPSSWGNISGDITNQTDLIAYIAGFGYTALVGDGTNTTYTVTHNLGTTAVLIELFEVSTGALVWADITVTSTNVVTVSFKTAPSSNAYKIVIKK